MPPLNILYEDNHLIAVFKPHGLPTQADKTKDISLFELVKQYLKNKYQKPGNVYLGLLHRLDRPVAGIVLFAKTSKGASRISEQIRNRTIKKTYTAILDNDPPKKTATLSHYLVKNVKTNKSKAHLTEAPHSKKAILHYTLIAPKTVQITLETGRHHQIRAQFASLKCPIQGDKKYGSTQNFTTPRGINLTATHLTFTHPTTQENIELVHATTPPT